MSCLPREADDRPGFASLCCAMIAKTLCGSQTSRRRGPLRHPIGHFDACLRATRDLYGREYCGPLINPRAVRCTIELVDDAVASSGGLVSGAGRSSERDAASRRLRSAMRLGQAHRRRGGFRVGCRDSPFRGARPNSRSDEDGENGFLAGMHPVKIIHVTPPPARSAAAPNLYRRRGPKGRTGIRHVLSCARWSVCDRPEAWSRVALVFVTTRTAVDTGIWRLTWKRI